MVLLENTLLLDHTHTIRSTFLVILFYGATLKEFQMNALFWFGFCFVLLFFDQVVRGLKQIIQEKSISLWYVSLSLFQLSSFIFSSAMYKLHIFLELF